jgi:hypothetical protein
MNLRKFVTLYIIIDEKHVKIVPWVSKLFILILSAFRNNVAKLHLHSVHHSGDFNNNVFKLWVLLNLQAVHCRSAATLETVTK